jgi:preprotein translocase subunit YajC
MIDTAWAQGAAGASGAPPILVTLLPLFAVLGIFYLLLFRPQQQQAKQHREMLDNLRRNDDVMTSGGIYGKIVALTDDVATLEVAPNVRIRVNRAQISSVVSAPRPDNKSKDKEKDRDK